MDSIVSNSNPNGDNSDSLEYETESDNNNDCSKDLTPQSVKQDLDNVADQTSKNKSNTTDELVKLLKSFYLKYNPEKVDLIPHILESYEGIENQIFSHLIEKYNLSEEEYSMFQNDFEKFSRDLISSRQPPTLQPQSITTADSPTSSSLSSTTLLPSNNSNNATRNTASPTPASFQSPLNKCQSPNSSPTLTIPISLLPSWNVSGKLSSTSIAPSSSSTPASDSSSPRNMAASTTVETSNCSSTGSTTGNSIVNNMQDISSNLAGKFMEGWGNLGATLSSVSYGTSSATSTANASSVPTSTATSTTPVIPTVSSVSNNSSNLSTSSINESVATLKTSTSTSSVIATDSELQSPNTPTTTIIATNNNTVMNTEGTTSITTTTVSSPTATSLPISLPKTTTAVIPPSTEVEILKADVLQYQNDKSRLTEVIRKLKYQVEKQQQVHSKLTSELSTSTATNQNLEKSILSIVERESTTMRENQQLKTTVNNQDITLKDSQEKLSAMSEMKESYFRQLQEAITLNHRLGNQVHHLSSHLIQSHLVDAIVTTASDSNNNNNNNNNNSNTYEIQLQPSTTDDNDNSNNNNYINAINNNRTLKYIDEALSNIIKSLPTINQNNITNNTINNNITANSTSAEGIDSISSDPSDTNNNTAIISTAYTQHQSDDDKAMIKLLQSSLIASRLELQFTIQQLSNRDEKLSDNQTLIDSLQSQLATFLYDLETASGSADVLRKQLHEQNQEIQKYKSILQKHKQKEEKRVKEIKLLEEQIISLQNELSSTLASKNDLITHNQQQTIQNEEQLQQYLIHHTEQSQFQQEELLTTFSNLQSIQKEVSDLELKNISEINQKLQLELVKSRQMTEQKEYEVSFLQTQLVEAVQKITDLMNIQKQQQSHSLQQSHQR